MPRHDLARVVVGLQDVAERHALGVDLLRGRESRAAAAGGVQHDDQPSPGDRGVRAGCLRDVRPERGIGTEVGDGTRARWPQGLVAVVVAVHRQGDRLDRGTAPTLLRAGAASVPVPVLGEESVLVGVVAEHQDDVRIHGDRAVRRTGARGGVLSADVAHRDEGDLPDRRRCESAPRRLCRRRRTCGGHDAQRHDQTSAGPRRLVPSVSRRWGPRARSVGCGRVVAADANDTPLSLRHEP